MFRLRTFIVVGFAGCALALASVGPTSIHLGTQPALAKNGHGGGNGNSASASNKSSGGGPGKSASVSGKSASARGHSAKPTSAPTAAEAVDKPRGLDAKVAGLHAVNANLSAFIHASPNSRVGRIAAYAMDLVKVEDATAAQVAAQMTLDDAATALSEAQSTWWDSVQVLSEQFGYADISSDALEASMTALLATDTTGFSEDELAAHEAERAAIEQALASAAVVDAAQTAYDTANDTLKETDQALADAEETANDALNAAANANRTPVDDEVKTYVDAALEEGGILDYFRAQEEDLVVE